MSVQELMLAVAFMAAPVTAGATCFVASESAMTLTSWKLGAKMDNKFPVEMVVTSNLAKSTKLVDGYIYFQDAFEQPIGSIDMPKRLRIAPEESTQIKLSIPSFLKCEQLSVLTADEIVPSICVKAVLYDDGAKEEFSR